MAWRRDSSSCCSLRVAVSTLLHGAFHPQPLYILFIESAWPDTKMQLHILLCAGGLALVTFPQEQETKNSSGGYASPKTCSALTPPACSHAPGCMQCLSRKEGVFSLGSNGLLQRAGSFAKTDPTAQCLGISNSSSSSRKLWYQTPAADSAFCDISIFSKHLYHQSIGKAQVGISKAPWGKGWTAFVP